MSDNYENHSGDNQKVSHHFINTCYFNFYETKSKRSVRSLALTLTLDEIFTLGARARHRASKTRALHITASISCPKQLPVVTDSLSPKISAFQDKCQQLMAEIAKRSVEEVAKEQKCDSGGKICFPENQKKGYECCASFDVLDRMISGIETIKECDQNLINSEIENSTQELEEKKIQCSEYLKSSEKCAKLRGLRTIGLSIEPMACVLYLMASLFIALHLL